MQRRFPFKPQLPQLDPLTQTVHSRLTLADLIDTADSLNVDTLIDYLRHTNQSFALDAALESERQRIA